MRTQLLLPSLLALALSACSGSDPVSSDAGAPESTPVAKKNVIFFLGDGMGITTMTAARIYKAGEEGMLTMDQLPETAFVHTYAKDNQITDSAASMAAYMTGVKMNNGVISMSADTVAKGPDGEYQKSGDSTCPAGNGSPVETLLEQMKAGGYGTGVISTARITHATPAAAYSHVCTRNAENTIAAALVPGGAGFNSQLGDGVDVLLGGGRSYFEPKENGGKRTDKRDLVAELKKANYNYASNRDEFNALPVDGSKMVGLFTSSHMAYDLDRDPAKEPSLAEMTGKAIDALSNNKKGFFLTVEGGRIDHALHGSNARRALQDTVAFDDAIATALEKMEKLDPGLANTLIVYTADHDHTLVMNGYAQRVGKTEPGKPGILGVVKNYVTGQPATDVDGKPYTILGFGTGPNRKVPRDPIDDSTLESADYQQETTVPMGSETHGGTDVFLGAKGKGAENFKGTITNTDVYGLIRKAMNL